MSDIFREVEEDVRRERLERIWKDYGDYIVAGIALVIIAGAGLQLWRYYHAREIARASDTYLEAEQMAANGQYEHAATAFGKLADDAPSGYAQIARLQHADALLANGDARNALQLYKEIAAGDNELLANTARIRAGWATVETSSRGELEDLLAPMTSAGSAWRHMAREILAYSDYRRGAVDDAQKEYKKLADDKDAPSALRDRARAMSIFIAAGGDHDYGTVPQPPKPPAAQTPQDLLNPQVKATPPATDTQPQDKAAQNPAQGTKPQ
ncbi:MAG: tetratricopeptide repeat protein [Proteobacteria bacterium]|nr:tetratricopeptide repeat protein [Pseudomonadota bacterium]